MDVQHRGGVVDNKQKFEEEEKLYVTYFYTLSTAGTGFSRMRVGLATAVVGVRTGRAMQWSRLGLLNI